MRDEFERLNYKYKASERAMEEAFMNQYSIPITMKEQERKEENGQEFSNEGISDVESR